MKINAKMHYGLKTMIELGMHAGESGIMQKDLAEKLCIPVKFMDAVIRELKVAGLVVRLPGKNAGFKLTRDLGKISAYDVYRAFEPRLHIHFCLADSETCPNTCSCASRYFLFNLNRKMESFMESNSLEKLVKVQADLSEHYFAGDNWVI